MEAAIATIDRINDLPKTINERVSGNPAMHGVSAVAIWNMKPPSLRKPGSPDPIPSSSTNESSVGFFGLAGAVFAGAFVSGIAMVFGEAISAPPGSGQVEIYPLLYFLGGGMFSIPISMLGIGIWRMIAGRNHPGLFSVPYFFVPTAALIVGLLIPFM